MGEETSIIPLYDRVKNQIYDDFERVSRQESIVLKTKSSRTRAIALRIFRMKFARFFNNLYSLTTYEMLPKKYRSFLEYYRENLDKINSVKKISKLTIVCSLSIRELEITKIEYTNRNEAF